MRPPGEMASARARARGGTLEEKSRNAEPPPDRPQLTLPAAGGGAGPSPSAPSRSSDCASSLGSLAAGLKRVGAHGKADQP